MLLLKGPASIESFSFQFNANFNIVCLFVFVFLMLRFRWCHYLESRDLNFTRPLGKVGDNTRCAVDDPNGVLINIATPGWNEYEEEFNCGTMAKPTPKAEGRVQRACMLIVIIALVSALLPLL